MTRTIVSGITTIRSRRSFKRQPITVEKNILHSQPEEAIPGLPLWVCEIHERLWRFARGLLLIADVLIKKWNCRGDALHQIWPRIGQHPNIAQTIVVWVGV